MKNCLAILEFCLKNKIQMPPIEMLDLRLHRLTGRQQILLSYLLPKIDSLCMSSICPADEESVMSHYIWENQYWNIGYQALAAFQDDPSLLGLFSVDRVKEIGFGNKDKSPMTEETLSYLITIFPNLKMIYEDGSRGMEKPSNELLKIIEKRQIACFRNSEFYSWSYPNDCVDDLSITSDLLELFTVQEIIIKFPNITNLSYTSGEISKEDMSTLIKGLKHLEEVADCLYDELKATFPDIDFYSTTSTEDIV